MQKPQTPDDEKHRLNTLNSLQLLDTPAEERFDRVTRLAKRLFQVPIALVSLVDENRQWFKSCYGLDVNETSRDISFCGHAILGDEIFVIPDAAEDDRFADNPLVVDKPHIRFYAGCPIKYIDGSKLGTLCIIDSKPRLLDQQNLEPLKDLAKMVEQEIAALQMATMDDLTHISNRRGFSILAQKSLDLCARKQISASLVFLDLNQFKPINDRFGHAEGDRALIAFADQMRNAFRESDVFARLGGDEFVVLLTDTSEQAAREAIERFRESIAEYNELEQRGYAINFSEGILSIDHDKKQPIEDLLAEADRRMYKMKKQR